MAKRRVVNIRAYTLEMAKRDSLKKWEFFASNDFKHRSYAAIALEKKYPELKKFDNYCGFCHYADIMNKHLEIKFNLCGECKCKPICKGVYWRWVWDPTKANALKVLKKIHAIKVGRDA